MEQVFRQQSCCTDAQQVAFATALGSVEPPLAGDPAAAPNGEPVFIMSNIDPESSDVVPSSDVRVAYAAVGSEAISLACGVWVFV